MAEQVEQNELVFKLTVTKDGYGVETNMSTAEASFWLGVLHVQYSQELIAQNKPV